MYEQNTSRAGKIALWAIVGLIVGTAAGYAVGNKYHRHTRKGASASQHMATSNTDKQLALRLAMRKLWADHVIWTREYVIGAIDGTADVQEAAKRLMKNQEDIGAAVIPYYGQAAGDKLTALLKEHISIAVDLIDAAKKKDNAKFDNANKRWQQNAEGIAGFLAQANPNWPKDAIAEAMSMHLQTTTDEAVARLNKDYAGDVKAFDAVFGHILNMADTLSDGIIKQFPDKF